VKVALLNPAWSFDHSIYFGCRHEHLPLELGACALLLQQAGHETLMLDGALMAAGNAELVARIKAFRPDMTVVATAPTYLFWRCAQPELRVPRDVIAALGADGGMTVAVGPHGSATPEATLRKLGCDVAVMGECEEVVVALASAGQPEGVASTAFLKDGHLVKQGGAAATRFTDLPAIAWPVDWLQRHPHHHHRYGTEAVGPGAEVEASRGCPYHCSFCAKIDFRDKYRKRDLDIVIAEIDGLIAAGATYVYFVDEIFLPQKPLLEALVDRPIQFGVQTRIDLWKPDMLDLLGAAGCVSIEAGVESLTVEGRAALDKMCRMSTEELSDRLIHARKTVPFVQANLLEMSGDDVALVEQWRERLIANGVWANDPVPLYPYPSSPEYRKLWGEPDGQAWERAHEHYLAQFDHFSDIQEERPLPLRELEAACAL
jgi:anaerobic magnesium-protoporphyrin IX monomethyl ester cyclase